MPNLGLEWELCTYLASAAVATFGTNLFATLLPDQPDTCLALRVRGGMRPLMVLTGTPSGPPRAEMQFDRPNIQVRCRAAASSFAAGNDLIQAAYAALEGKAETTLRSGGPLFHLIRANQSPQYLGRDVKERHEWSQNFQVWWDNPQR